MAKYHRILTALVLGATTGGFVQAQHATGADVENGARAYESSCATCHGPDGNLIAGIDFGRGVYRRDLSDAEIIATIRNGIPNTPMPPMPGISPEQATEIVAYLRSLPDTLAATDAVGDAARGRDIVENRSDCLNCHRAGGSGSHVGPDLGRIGLERRAVEIEQALIDPDAEIRAESRFVEVELESRERVTGRLLNQDTFTIQVLDFDERLRSIDKSDVRTITFLPSPMESYADEFDAQELADVVAYLTSLRGEGR